MGLFQRTDFADLELDEVGLPIESLGRALVVWVAMQDRAPITIAEAALAFNTAPEVIREAIDLASYILYSPAGFDPAKQIIELDGE